MIKEEAMNIRVNFVTANENFKIIKKELASLTEAIIESNKIQKDIVKQLDILEEKIVNNGDSCNNNRIPLLIKQLEKATEEPFKKHKIAAMNTLRDVSKIVLD